MQPEYPPYCPAYHNDGRQMHFIFDFARKIHQGKTHGTPVILWGDGFQRRELIHVSDFVRTLLTLADTTENDLINIGAGAEHTIREFAEMLCRHTGFPSDKIQYDTSRYVGAKSKCLDITKLRTHIPDLTPRFLDEGLGEVVSWVAHEFSRSR